MCCKKCVCVCLQQGVQQQFPPVPSRPLYRHRWGSYHCRIPGGAVCGVPLWRSMCGENM
jgi:hypothetical protein